MGEISLEKEEIKVWAVNPRSSLWAGLCYVFLFIYLFIERSVRLEKGKAKGKLAPRG